MHTTFEVEVITDEDVVNYLKKKTAHFEALKSAEINGADQLCKMLAEQEGYRITLNPLRDGDCITSCVSSATGIDKVMLRLGSLNNIAARLLYIDKLFAIDKRRSNLSEDERRRLSKECETLESEYALLRKPGAILNGDHIQALADLYRIEFRVSKTNVR